MAPAVPNRSWDPLDRPHAGDGPEPTGGVDYARLQANSSHPDVQAVIRKAIRLRRVRVRPVPGCPDRVDVFGVTAPDRPGVPDPASGGVGPSRILHLTPARGGPDNDGGFPLVPPTDDRDA